MKVSNRGGARYDADGNLKTGKKTNPEGKKKVRAFSVSPELDEWITEHIKENKLNFSAWIVGLIEKERNNNERD